MLSSFTSDPRRLRCSRSAAARQRPGTGAARRPPHRRPSRTSSAPPLPPASSRRCSPHEAGRARRRSLRRGPLTVFAPTDAAFKAVPKATLASSRRTAPPSGACSSTTSSRATSPPLRSSSCARPRRWPARGPHPGARRLRLPQRLDEGRQDRHRRHERDDPRHEQGPHSTGRLNPALRTDGRPSSGAARRA